LFFLRATPAMGVMLAVHLGVVFALFLTLPYGKFVHGLYRFLALIQYAREYEKNRYCGSSNQEICVLPK
jgi:citrate/tricarballylate utilization protein